VRLVEAGVGLGRVEPGSFGRRVALLRQRRTERVQRFCVVGLGLQELPKQRRSLGVPAGPQLRVRPIEERVSHETPVRSRGLEPRQLRVLLARAFYRLGPR